MKFNITPQLPSNGLTCTELFAGGGLMAVGLKASGFNIIWANDFDINPVKSYRHNIGDHIVHGDITQIPIKDIPDSDIIAGGPPCQDYSLAGRGEGEEGERGKLVWTYLNIIEKKQPKAFIFENVPGLITKKHIHTFNALLSRFDEIGYKISWKPINAWDYGVAQTRKRVFIVGIRKALNIEFRFPEPLTEDYQTQVLYDAIGDLPWPHGIELSDKAIDYLTRDPRHLKKHKPAEYDKPCPTLPAVLHKGVPYGLFYPNHNYKEISDKALEGYKRRNAPGAFGFRINGWDDPSPTIMGRIFNEGKAFVHPETKPRPRRFSVRECLRIQSVPDWYVIPDTVTLGHAYRIVGNGVASRVAWYLGKSLAEQIKSK